MSRWQTLKSEIISQEPKKRLFFLLALCIHFLIMIDASITKPAVNSIFLTHFATTTYPYVWLLSIPLNLGMVLLYNRFITRIGCRKMLLCIVLLTCTFHTFASFTVASNPYISFLLYLWKDLYIILMFHQIWSLIHTLSGNSKIQYLYGLFFIIGNLGGMLGSFITRNLALPLGSEVLLLFTLPIYLLLTILYQPMFKAGGLAKENVLFSLSKDSPSSALAMIGRSKTLKLILSTVVLMQLSVTLMDYRFNYFLEIHLPNQDLRTAFCGSLWLLVENSVLVVQIFTIFFVARYLGDRKGQLFTPLLLLLNLTLSILFPSFLVVASTYGIAKSIDYSIFHILKEMLYAPLSKMAKFKARAFIDIFAYRSTKALASILLLGGQLLFPATLPALLPWTLLTLYLIWIISSAYFLRRPTLLQENRPQLEQPVP